MKKILCIEDNRLNMRLVRKILSHSGYKVLEAPDGATGLRLAFEEMPDLIFVDVNLPDIDGLEVTARIKADPTCTHIPVIALTANAMHGDREYCLAAGCDGYVAKPVGRQELLDTVTHYLTESGDTQASA